MEDLRERVEAVERALTDGNGELTALAEGAASAERVDELSKAVDSLRDEVAELSAATQALRGYVGNVRSVNEAVEERADAAVAAADSLEQRVERLESSASASSHHEQLGESSEAESDSQTRHTTTKDVQGSAAAPKSQTCSACGRPADGAAAPDGGRERGSQDGRRSTGSRSRGRSTDLGDLSTTRESLAGFDPNDRGNRVPVREETVDPGQETAVRDRDVEDTQDATLVDRMRELL